MLFHLINLDNRVVTLQREFKSNELSTWTPNDDALLKKHGPLLLFKTHEVEYPISGMAKAIFSLMPASKPSN